MKSKFKILRGLMRVFVFMLLVSGQATFAQVPPPAAVPPSEAISVQQSGNISIDFQDADIRTVLRVLALKSGVNIVVGPEVVGLVTIELKDVPWRQALDVILSTYGYSYDRKGDIIVVSTIENLKTRRENEILLAEQEQLITLPFTLNYAKASDIMNSLEAMKTERGNVEFDERTNTVIIRDIPSNIERMSEVITQLDTTTPQVLIEAKIVETTLNDQENLGVNWVVKASLSGTKRPHTWPFSQDSKDKSLQDNFPGADTDDFDYGTLDLAQMQAVLELLSTRTDTNILSNPRIVTLDNQEANIVVGSQYPIPTYTYNEEQAQLQVDGWDYLDIGVIFSVTPHVNRAGFVTLDIEPKVTAILDFVTVENTSLPRLSAESAKTSVMIKDGETLVIAGLIKDQKTEIKNKVPFFGSIPILGHMFRKTETNTQKQDLLIFLTPHIITPDVASSVPQSASK